MLNILHKGIQVNLPLDPSEISGTIEESLAKAYVVALDAGVPIAIDGSGNVQLADGVKASNLEPIGFLVNDAAGYFYENRPALASGLVAVTLGNCVIETDKIDTALTFAFGELLYAGTGAKVGMVTNVEGTGARVIGIAGSSASSSQTTLKIYVTG